LLGNPTTVVGMTPNVAGTITVDWSDPTNSKVGTIQIDATSLATDRNQRNGAIHRFILQTGQYPTITFEPTAIEGLPASVNPGDALTFRVTGNLKIREISVPVTFDVTATAGESEISGDAKANITRTAYELTIPSVPSVANVTDDVALALKFVATKQ
jgi:polyisoprenoid-binding protein YceI